LAVGSGQLAKEEDMKITNYKSQITNKLQIPNYKSQTPNKKFLRGPGAVFIKRAPGRRRQ
jgi:hypothetical protein